MTTLNADTIINSMSELMKLYQRYEPDPFGFGDFSRQRLGGLDIIESPDIPRYVLPEELMPGVPWPPGFRDEINRWSRSFLGTTNAIAPGFAYVMADRYVLMRPNDICKIIAAS